MNLLFKVFFGLNFFELSLAVLDLADNDVEALTEHVDQDHVLLCEFIGSDESVDVGLPVVLITLVQGLTECLNDCADEL